MSSAGVGGALLGRLSAQASGVNGINPRRSMLRAARIATTALSHQKPAPSREVGHFARLARRSQRLWFVNLLAGVGALGSGGCLIADAPDYGGPQRTTPFILSSSISPSPYELIEVQEDDPPQDFSFRVYSEDVNDKLRIAFYRDYLLVEPLQHLDDRSYPPSTLDNPHNISLDLNLTVVPSGCHQLTLLVMHDSTWDDATDAPYPDKPLDDISSVTWWMNVRPDPNDPGTLYDCPRSFQVAESR
jgi:hypothetical protein